MPSAVSNSRGSSSQIAEKTWLDWEVNKVPFRRRLQTGAVLMFMLTLPIVGACWTVMLLSVYIPLIGIFSIGYLAYIFWLDTNPMTGAAKSKYFRSLSYFNYFKEFFPISLVKTAELNPDEKFVIAYHPHGIIGLGAILSFGSEALGWEKLFPGIDAYLVTLPINFRTPFLRQIWLAMGICDCSKEAFKNILGKGTGRAVAVIVGGAAEALNSHPGTMELKVMSRKGFLRQAMLNQASVVPSIGFGETDVWDTLKSNWLGSLQERLQRMLGFATPIFYGRGIFTYSYGFLPHRRPIRVVIGKPIKLPVIADIAEKGEKWLISDPEGRKLVDECHSHYVKALKALWDDHADDFYQGNAPVLKIT